MKLYFDKTTVYVLLTRTISFWVPRGQQHACTVRASAYVRAAEKRRYGRSLEQVPRVRVQCGRPC